MIKKLKPEDDDQRMADAMHMSSQEIWQAGLHAFAKAQEEGGKMFSMQVFEERVLRASVPSACPRRPRWQLQARVDELSAQLAALQASHAERSSAR
jgi:hypothetical protein